MAAVVLSCAKPNCTKPADLQCPVCRREKLNVPSSFCSKECFKEAWPSHKLHHPGAHDPWPNFHYTGPLRPWPYAPALKIPKHIPQPDYAETGVPASELDVRNRLATTVPVLTEVEIEGMRTVCRLAREVLDEAGRAVKAGATGADIDRVVHEACLQRGAYPSPYNYQGFPRSCCVSVNEVICHGIPDLRPFVSGDIVNIDVTLYYGGFHGDLNEMYMVGEVSEESHQLVRCARECLEKAVQQVRPGVPFKELGGVIEKHARSFGFSVVRNFCGHGIGRLFHGPPSIPHYTKNRAVGFIKKGQVFTIEPMINVGAWQDTIWPDNWTAVTIDGKRSAQFEHTILVTEAGCEILTAAAGQKRIIE